MGGREESLPLLRKRVLTSFEEESLPLCREESSPLLKMELHPGFLLLLLTWSADDTICKSFETTTEDITDAGGIMLNGHQVPLLEGNMSAGEDVEIVHEGKLGYTPSAEEVEKVYDDETNREMTDILYEGDSNASTGGDVETLGGEEVETSYDEKALKASGMTKVGDMWLNEDQLPPEMRSTNDYEATQESPAIQGWWYLWPGNVLLYRLSNSFGRRHKNRIRATLRSLEKKLDYCVRFKESHSSDRAVRVDRSATNQCWSSVGYQHNIGRRQGMTLGRWGWSCLQPRTIEHEFLHSLGVYHTQGRWDRDKYVKIIKDNVIKDMKFNFNKHDKSHAQTFGLPYDYWSVMHYSDTEFSKDGRSRTIVTRNRRFQKVIGRSSGVSRGDIMLIKKMYNCN